MLVIVGLYPFRNKILMRKMAFARVALATGNASDKKNCISEGVKARRPSRYAHTPSGKPRLSSLLASPWESACTAHARPLPSSVGAERSDRTSGVVSWRLCGDGRGESAIAGRRRGGGRQVVVVEEEAVVVAAAEVEGGSEGGGSYSGRYNPRHHHQHHHHYQLLPSGGL